MVSYVASREIGGSPERIESEENLIGSPTIETGLKKTAKLAEKEKPSLPNLSGDR